MIREALSNIAGVELFSIIPLILFIVIFAGVLVWVSRLDQTLVKKWSRIPLDHDSVNQVKHDDREIV